MNLCIKSKSEILRNLLDENQEVASEKEAEKVEEVQNDKAQSSKIETVNLEDIKLEPQKELTEEELKESKYKALMGLAHEDLPFADRLEYLQEATLDIKETDPKAEESSLRIPYRKVIRLVEEFMRLKQ